MTLTLTPPPPAIALLLLLIVAAGACGDGDAARIDVTVPLPPPAIARAETLSVLAAGSLARPFDRALSAWVAERGARGVTVVVRREHAGSVEAARIVSELGRVPDVIALADREVFPRLLQPEHVAWYAEFARNRMVLAYTDRSRGAGPALAGDGWLAVLQRPDVEVGRSSPALDPAGYRALLVWQLAERHYRRPGLAAALARHAPLRNVRPKSADLVALLQTGAIDYAWTYESVARGAGLRALALPAQIDLGSPAESLFYAGVQVRVEGRVRAEDAVIRGLPIVYAFAVPRRAPHRAAGEAFVVWLGGPAGQAALRAAGIEVLLALRIVGDSVPAGIAALGAPRAAEITP